MSMKMRLYISGLIIGLITGVVFTLASPWVMYKIFSEEDLVKQGHGIYYLDENHNKRFKLNPPCTAESLKAFNKRLKEEKFNQLREDAIK